MASDRVQMEISVLDYGRKPITSDLMPPKHLPQYPLDSMLNTVIMSYQLMATVTVMYTLEYMRAFPCIHWQIHALLIRPIAVVSFEACRAITPLGLRHCQVTFAVRPLERFPVQYYFISTHIGEHNYIGVSRSAVTGNLIKPVC